MNAAQARRPADTGQAEGHADAGTEGIYSDEAAHATLSPFLSAELSRLYASGFSLLPLGGEDGKKPIVEFRDRARLPLAVVVNRLIAAGSATYGIRLPGLMVIDVDTDTPEARLYVERRFGTSPVCTKTRRGFHLYFRSTGAILRPSNVDLPGIRIDFKTGPNEFVVGPRSERPDGVVYHPLGRLVSISELPTFEDRDLGAADAEPTKVGDRFPVGCRHKALKRRAYQLARVADNYGEVLADLLAFREWEIDRPEDFPDAQVANLAAWFWHKRECGKLWSKRDSAVLIHRNVIDELARRGDGTAFLLHAILVADHGHQPDRPFSVVPDGLKAARRLKAGKRQIYDAIDVLVGLNLLVIHSKPKGKRNSYLYLLGDGAGSEKEGEGSKIILVSETDTHFRGLAA